MNTFLRHIYLGAAIHFNHLSFRGCCLCYMIQLKSSASCTSARFLGQQFNDSICTQVCITRQY